MLQKGKIKFYNSGRNSGFISSDLGEDVFFHKDGVVDPKDVNRLWAGVNVSFNIERDAKGRKKAVGIRIVK